MTTITEARDAMLTVFRTAWLADGTTSPIPVKYGDDVTFVKPVADGAGNAGPWAWVNVRHTDGRAESIGGPGFGKDLFSGFVTVQVFTPIGTGRVLADAAAQVAKRAFQRQSFSSGWFASVVVAEVGVDGPWQQTNVTSQFFYGDDVP